MDGTMTHRFVNPDSLAPARGFSHAVVATPGTTVYLGGQVAFDADGAVVGETMAEQYGIALGNVVTALEAAGGTPTDIVSMVVYVTDMDAYRSDLSGIGTAHRAHLDRHFPAIALIGVSELVEPAALVEIVATAVIPGT
ncbi:MAG: RidA family protein [Acidimicrobiia bacterium]|nr:RidA family protein [Acidimicrobiia bacterium]